MSIITLIVILIIIAVVLAVINNPAVIPMDPRMKIIINAVIIIAVLLWLLSVFAGGSGFVIGGPRRW
jgi:hypothetical protein